MTSVNENLKNKIIQILKLNEPSSIDKLLGTKPKEVVDIKESKSNYEIYFSNKTSFSYTKNDIVLMKC